MIFVSILLCNVAQEGRSKWRIVKYNAMIGTEAPSVPEQRRIFVRFSKLLFARFMISGVRHLNCVIGIISLGA